jgi:hypothetical protein
LKIEGGGGGAVADLGHALSGAIEEGGAAQWWGWRSIVVWSGHHRASGAMEEGGVAQRWSGAALHGGVNCRFLFFLIKKIRERISRAVLLFIDINFEKESSH